MKVSELIMYLESYDPDAEVRLAEQPGWPFEYSINNVVDVVDPNNDEKKIIYLVEGEQIDYLTESARKEIGW